MYKLYDDYDDDPTHPTGKPLAWPRAGPWLDLLASEGVGPEERAGRMPFRESIRAGRARLVEVHDVQHAWRLACTIGEAVAKGSHSHATT